MPQPVPHATTQTRYEVRFDWGLDGLASIAPEAGVIVVIDAVSFTTTTELATGLGLTVVPFDGVSDPIEAARLADAAIAGPRGGAGLTLSPSSITAENAASTAPNGRVLLPSLNGSRVASAAARHGVPVVAANLRNRTAVARWILRHQEAIGRRAMVAVIASGERRADGTLRFAVEDQLAAGAVIDALQSLGIDFCSPEAALAAASFTGLERAVGHLMTAAVTGQEMAEAGQLEDVRLAARIDVSGTVPVLADGVFRAA